MCIGYMHTVECKGNKVRRLQKDVEGIYCDIPVKKDKIFPN
jgi:hypothetical protein